MLLNFLYSLFVPIKGGIGQLINPPPPHTHKLSRQEGEGQRFDMKLNICIVVHALLCKVLPDNCTCVNTLNADFVLKQTNKNGYGLMQGPLYILKVYV